MSEDDDVDDTSWYCMVLWRNTAPGQQFGNFDEVSPLPCYETIQESQGRLVTEPRSHYLSRTRRTAPKT